MSTALNEVFECPRVGLHILQDAEKLLQVVVGFEIRHTRDGSDARRDSTHYFISRSNVGVGAALVLAFHCVTEAFAICVLDAAFLGAVMFWGRIQVPTIH